MSHIVVPESVAIELLRRNRPAVYMLYRCFWRAGCRVNGMRSA